MTRPTAIISSLIVVQALEFVWNGLHGVYELAQGEVSGLLMGLCKALAAILACLHDPAIVLPCGHASAQRLFTSNARPASDCTRSALKRAAFGRLRTRAPLTIPLCRLTTYLPGMPVSPLPTSSCLLTLQGTGSPAQPPTMRPARRYWLPQPTGAPTPGAPTPPGPTTLPARWPGTARTACWSRWWSPPPWLPAQPWPPHSAGHLRLRLRSQFLHLLLQSPRATTLAAAWGGLAAASCVPAGRRLAGINTRDDSMTLDRAE